MDADTGIDPVVVVMAVMLTPLSSLPAAWLPLDPVPLEALTASFLAIP